MKLSKSELDSILEELQDLDIDYWHNRYSKRDKSREKSNEDTRAVVLFILDSALEDISEYLYSFYGKYAEEGVVTGEIARINMTSKELSELIDYLNELLDEAGIDGISFDSDIEEAIEDLSTEKNVTRIEGLTLRIKSRLELAYGLIDVRVTNHLGRTVRDSYYTTLYEAYYASGYSPKPRRLTEDDILAILAIAWRASGESYDDTIWRYKRELGINLENTVKQNTDFGFGINDLIQRVHKYFNTDYNNLSRLIRTDSTYYSTKGQVEAFQEVEIEKALYCTIDDERRSEICTEADGNIIPVDEIMPWVNAPPLHYNCRSWLAPIIVSVDFLNGEVMEIADDSFDTWYRSWDY